MARGDLTDSSEDAKMQMSRRRQRDNDEDEGTVVGADVQVGSDLKSLDAEGSGNDGNLLSGCGRTVCKSCSVESIQTCVL